MEGEAGRLLRYVMLGSTTKYRNVVGCGRAIERMVLRACCYRAVSKAAQMGFVDTFCDDSLSIQEPWLASQVDMTRSLRFPSISWGSYIGYSNADSTFSSVQMGSNPQELERQD